MKSVTNPGAPLAFAALVSTNSFSGYAFSVTRARGRFNSPRAQCGFVQNRRKYAITSSISSDDSNSPNAGMIVEKPRAGPPRTIIAFQVMFGSAVVCEQFVKSGNVFGRLNTVLVAGAPLPCSP